MLCFIRIEKLDERNSANFETFSGALSDLVNLLVDTFKMCIWHFGSVWTFFEKYTRTTEPEKFKYIWKLPNIVQKSGRMNPQKGIKFIIWYMENLFIWANMIQVSDVAPGPHVF
jgi:hypothetical protein